MLKITSLIPSIAVPGSQILTNELERLSSSSTIRGLPDKNSEIIGMSSLERFVIVSIIPTFVAEKSKLSISPNPSA